MTNQVGTVVYAPIVPGENVMDDLPSAFGDQLGRAIHKFDSNDDRDSFSLAYKSRLYKSWCIVKPGLWYEWDGVKEDGSDGQWSQINGSDSARLSFDNIGNTNDTFIASNVSVAAPLKFEQPNSGNDRVTLTIDPSAYERQHTASYLAYLSDETNVVGKKEITKHAGALWFEDVIFSSPTYIQLDRGKKLIGIQEYDGLDPNVTGGQDYLIAFRVNMKGVAPEDGVIKVYLNEYDELGRDSGILVDSNSQPMAAERSYKAGEKLGALDVIGVVKATALRYFSCNIEDTFGDAYLTLTDPTEGVTGLMAQALTVGEKSSPALLQFEADTNQDISFSSHYLGPERVDFAWLIRSNGLPQVVPSGQGITMSDGYGIYNPT
ncbi:MAG: hypothetical protein ACRDCY_16480, partial [Aeromonas veronii]